MVPSSHYGKEIGQCLKFLLAVSSCSEQQSATTAETLRPARTLKAIQAVHCENLIIVRTAWSLPPQLACFHSALAPRLPPTHFRATANAAADQIFAAVPFR